MPVYIYRCENCGVQFERHQSFTDEPLKRCPECSKNSLCKVLTPAGIVFKGSGWYATDHKSASGAGRAYKAAENKETGASHAEGGSESTKSDNAPKPAAPETPAKTESAGKTTE